MKTTTFNLLSKTSLQIKHYLFTIVFLFIGLLQVNADCIIDTAATGGDNVMTGAELLAYITNNSCSGTLTIESPVDIILSSSITIPSSIIRIVIKNGGQILWANNNVDLNLQPNAAIVIENTTDIGTTTGALGSTTTTCSNNRAIYIGTIKYSACGGIGNVCVIFSDLIQNGGTIQIDPSFAIIDGTGNEVCFVPTDIEIELNGYYEGTPTYTWSKISGPGTVTFTPDNDTNTTVTVSDPGTYVIRITVIVPLSNECLDQFISVYNDLEIKFRDGLGATTMITTPGAGGTCNLNVDFTASTTNGGANLTYLWDFGDGNTSSLQNPSHTYASSDTYNVSLTVTDPDGLPPCNVVVVNEEVVVTDNTPPLINCPNDIIVSNDIDSCGAVVTYTTPIGTDNCTNASTSLIAGLASGSNFPIGTTLVTYEVTDETGNKTQCSFNVTVNDTQDPVITCPANVTADTSNDGEGNCSTTVSLGTPVTNDNCGIKSVVAQVAGVDIDPITFEFDLGETIVTWIVTDNSDRTAACNQTVTVVDDESPRFDAPPTATISCNDDPNDLTLTGTVTRHNIDNCDTTPLDPVYTDSTAPGTCPIITVITRTWAIYDLAGNFHTHTQTINVVPDALVISNVPDETISSGTYTTQEDLDAAFATWLNNFSVSGGCNPSGIFAEQYTAPDLCGGSVDIVYNVTDLCQSGQDIATFTVESANPLIISDIQNLTVNACDFADQAALDTAFANWIAGFNVTGGISPNGQFADQYTAPTLCDGGATAVTYDVTDVCASGQDTATFTVNKPSDLVISDIANQIIPAGTYATQNDLDTAFAAWLNNFTVSGGCNPQATDLSSLTAPDLCGGSVNVVYNVTDLCESGQDVATFTIESSDPLVISDVQDLTVDTCDFADQAALDTAFADWIAGFTVSGGISPNGQFANQYTAPILCDGGATAVTYDVTDLCASGQDTATFTLNAPTAITYTAPVGTDLQSCDYADQTEVSTAFSTWVTAQTNAFAIANGCAPVLTNDSASVTVPELCTGGTATVKWTISDLCETIEVSADFNLTKPAGINHYFPDPVTVSACDFENQEDFDTKFAEWVDAEIIKMDASYEGGCAPFTTHNFTNQTIDICTGGEIVITWLTNDKCEVNHTHTTTYTLTAPPAITYTAPEDADLQSCDYADQTEVSTAFSTWVTAQTNAFAIANGCAPVLTNDSASVTVPELCTGGTATVKWTISDLCETIEVSADFNLTAPTAITYTAPVGADLQSCDYADQTEVSTAFSTWVTAQTNAFAIANGCAPVLTNDSASVTVPELCTGGTATVKWSISDLCETIEVSADFNLTAPTAITYNAPVGTELQSCDYADQTEVNTAFSTWVTAQTNAFAIANGCAPVLTNDSASVTVPELCTGGAATVKWTISDLCETIEVSADFNLTKPAGINHYFPDPVTVSACDFENQEDFNTKFAEWVDAEIIKMDASYEGGCAPFTTHNFTNQTIDICTGGEIVITWLTNDKCEVDHTHTTTYTLTAPPAITYTAPEDADLQSCDYADQTEVSTAFSTWVTAQTNAFAIANGCAPVLTNDSASVTVPELCTGGTATVKWTISDLCETIEVSADFNLTAPTAITYTSPIGTDLQSCDYADQTEVNTAFSTWVTAQTNAFAIANGCAPVLTNDSASVTVPELCTGGTATVKWTISDLCETIEVSADFNLTAPAAITYSAPSNDTSVASEFDDPDAAVAQANLDADIAAWITAQNTTITNSVSGGCDPLVTNDYTNQSITFCNSGSIAITWTITDLCETISSITATYTFTQPDGITFTDPSSKTADACDFDNDSPALAQTNLDADIAAWVSDQTAIITNSLTGGSPTVSHDHTDQSIALCDGGSITVNWTIEDICETINRSATYTLNAPTAITYTAPVGTDLQSCDYADQTEVITAFSTWVTAQTNAFAIANGCAPVLTNDSASVTVPELCTGGTATVKWTISDLCETIEVSADFNLTAPTAITYNAPVGTDLQSCDYADQTEVNTAFSTWVTAQTNAFAITNGCSPVLTNDSASVTVPELCTGGTATVKWTISDLCETIEVSADFNLTAPTAITYTAPVGTDLQSCDYADQTEVSTAFSTWVTAQTNAFAIANGCAPVLTNDSASVTVPELCTGGTATVKWTISDLCETIEVSADFNLTAPTAITYTSPVGTDLQSCDYADQTEVNTAFSTWVTAQTNAFAIANGCAPVLTNDSASVTVPELCTGGTATVKWTISDLCETIEVSADFNLTAPAAITYSAPSNDTSVASEFDDPDAAVAQANLDADIAAWITVQNTTITNSVSGGCDPLVTNDYTNQSITFCNSGSIAITWTITDLCETISSITATYTFTQPDGITFTDPSSKTADACDFDNDSPALAQTNLDADIAAWVSDQTAIITNSLTGGSPTVSHDHTDQSIALCDGGNITVNWTIEDICETINRSATYTLNAPTAITYTVPEDADLQSCDYADQTEVSTAFSTWVTAQTNAFAIANGCSSILTNDSASVTVPELCTGGTATVKWTISDLCETIEVSADFNLTAPTAITYNAPEDDSSTACEFDQYDAITAQSNLNADITAWVNNQTSIINTSIEGGCSPIVTNDFASQSIDFCTGGSLTITWQVQDLCGISTSTATYTYTKPTPVAFDQQNLPSNITVECDNIPNANVLTASTNCGEVNVIYNETRINGECASYYELVRTWKATDICGSSVEHTQTITVQDTTPPVLSLPVNVSAECSDDLSPIAFGSATATDNCDDNPVISYEDKRTDGACSGTYTITRTWKAIDACGNEATADQVISTSDTTAPEFVETDLPQDVTVECSTVPAAETLTATDNCGTATVTVNDVRADGNCANNYIITRTWTATDECGLTKTHIQTITVQDTTPPTFVETLPPTNLVVECDAVPVAETLTATDSCGSATVSVNDARTNGSCPNNYTLTRTWTATDECGNTTKHTQTITVQDTKAPQFVEALPNNITVECDAVPTAQTITATDNCGTAMVTVKDIVTNGDCPNNYIIARTWTATDECSNTTEHTQIITVQDTKAPVPAATFDEVLNVSCTNIPQAPTLTFTDNCSSAANVVVVFNETNTFQDNVYNDYEIVRTWTVRDECGNEAIYKQTLHVALDEIITDIVADDRCFDDGIVNLNDLIPSALNTNGTWELIEGNPAATLTGSIFNPTTLELGDDFLPDNGGVDYKFRYTTTDNGCISITDVTMNINADCVVLPCGENDVVISKAVTPNGDAYNESFDITGIDLCGFTADVKIFNRWGALIFESNSYTVGENMGEWKGSASKKSVGSASTVPNGTYYYIVTLKDSGLAPFTGPVYLGTK